MPSSKRERQRLYEQSFEPIQVHTGIAYPCDPQHLQSYRRFLGPNSHRLTHLEQATQEIIIQNSESRRERDFGRKEWEAMIRLTDGVKNAAETGWGPDVIIKMFADIDLVFFKGKLLGNVNLSWKDLHEPRLLEITQPRPGNQASIHLNPVGILLGGGPYQSPFKQMFGTMLHEMVHAYANIRAPECEQSRGDGHDANFRAMLHAIHRRAYDNLGVSAIARNEESFYYHHMSEQWAHEEGGGPLGPRNDGPIGLNHPFMGDGTERIPGAGRYGGGGRSYGEDELSAFMGLMGLTGLSPPSYGRGGFGLRSYQGGIGPFSHSRGGFCPPSYGDGIGPLSYIRGGGGGKYRGCSSYGGSRAGRYADPSRYGRGGDRYR